MFLVVNMLDVMSSMKHDLEYHLDLLLIVQLFTYLISRPNQVKIYNLHLKACCP